MPGITFIITDDEVDGGYCAKAHWPDGNRDLFTQGDNREELIENIHQVLDVTFGQQDEKPDVIHLHFVHDEVIAAR